MLYILLTLLGILALLLAIAVVRTLRLKAPAAPPCETVITEEEFIDRFTKLTESLLQNKNMMALCYTQLTDVEQEQNGLYTYDRKAKFPPEKVKAIFARKAAYEE